MTTTTESKDQDNFYEYYRVQADRGQEPIRIDKFLLHRLEGKSRNKVQNAIKAGNVLVNDQPVKASYKIKPFDNISVVMAEPPREYEIIPENIPLNIVFEDDYLIVINKEPGMVVHPGHGNYSGTLVHALSWHFENLPNSPGNEARPGLVHRIDKNTSGLMVVAKEELSMTHLARQFFDHSIDRKYTALVWGNIEADEGTIEGNIARSTKDRKIFRVYDEPETGKPAITHYKVLERFGYVTLVECILETGRTHQIRVHMKHIGHTLFQDHEYGGNKVLKGSPSKKYQQFVQNCFKLVERQCLHAQTLAFTHPITKKRMQFVSELPQDMSQAINKWRRYVAALSQ